MTAARGQAFVGDVAIKGDRIVAVGQVRRAAGPREIDAKGLIVAPGFIDLHSHSDGPILEAKTRLNANFLTQGCTTVVTGNCGVGPVDVARIYQKIDEHGAGTNVLHLMPHGSLRAEVMGRGNRPPSPAELDEDEGADRPGDARRRVGHGDRADLRARLVLEDRRAGRAGRGRRPSTAASMPRTFATKGASCSNRSTKFSRSAEQAKLPVHVSHIKVSGKANWGLAPDAIQKLRDARAAGQQVTADQYPYPASSTSLAATVIPDELRDWKVLKAALDDPEQGDKVRERDRRARSATATAARAWSSPISRSERSWQGKSLAAIAKETSRTPLDVALDIMSRGGAQVVSFGMNEDEVRLFMREPFVATASDGSASRSIRPPSRTRGRSAASRERSATTRSRARCCRWPRRFAAPAACRPISWACPSGAI